MQKERFGYQVDGPQLYREVRGEYWMPLDVHKGRLVVPSVHMMAERERRRELADSLITSRKTTLKMDEEGLKRLNERNTLPSQS